MASKVGDQAGGSFRLESVTARYGALTALRDISVTVHDSSVVAIIGPNGAGKSTMLRVASGLMQPATGRISLGSTDVTSWPPERRADAGICHVPEGRGIFPGLTVRENLILQASATTERDDIDAALHAFPILGERLKQIAGTLSGGQQQMLALARVVVSRAQFILLDEVSLGLAPIVVDQIYEFIGGLAAEGRSLLLVEQYVNRALAVADYVYLLANGAVRFHGKPSELDVEGVIESYLGGDSALFDTA
jgi:branched-chain amino acid transport system ATP-binding protein